MIAMAMLPSAFYKKTSQKQSKKIEMTLEPINMTALKAWKKSKEIKSSANPHAIDIEALRRWKASNDTAAQAKAVNE